MPRPKNPTPTYRFHKPSGNAYADYYEPLTGTRRSVCLGRWGSAESRQEHARVCAEVAAGSGRKPAADVTVSEVLLHFWNYAQDHYVRADGSKTSEVEEYRAVI